MSEDVAHIIEPIESLVLKEKTGGQYLCSFTKFQDGACQLITTDNKHNAKIYFTRAGAKLAINQMRQSNVDKFKLERFSNRADSE